MCSAQTVLNYVLASVWQVCHSVCGKGATNVHQGVNVNCGRQTVSKRKTHMHKHGHGAMVTVVS